MMIKKMFIMQVIFMVLICICDMCYAFNITKTPNTVESAEEFEFSLNMDTKVYLANGHLSYDPLLLEFISCTTSNIDIRENRKGDIAWIYVDPASTSNPTGLNNIKFKFKAKSVASNMETNLVMTDSVYIDLNENIYENANFTHPLTILAKEELYIPATGGIGKYVFIGCGTLVMVAGFVYLKKTK